MARWRMIRLMPIVLFVLGLAGCSVTQGLEGGDETGLCSSGDVRPCVCEGGTVGSQACDSFTKTWSVCLCAAGQGVDDGTSEGGDSGLVPVPSLEHHAGKIVVGGAELTSENYTLRLVVSAAPSSEVLESESFRLRLGAPLEKENP